ncbi:hypothetical protein QTP88_006465 [Uroleucon formosanum]
MDEHIISQMLDSDFDEFDDVDDTNENPIWDNDDVNSCYSSEVDNQSVFQDQIFDDIVQDNYINHDISHISDSDPDEEPTQTVRNTGRPRKTPDDNILDIDQNIINNIVIETNKYAAQQIASKVISPHSRLNKWYDMNESNSQADPNNRVYKLGSVINNVMTNSNNCMQPYDRFCIDESLIKFMGRLSFKQYIKNKKSRFGIKLFKLCISPCYTLAIKVYAGKEANAELNVGSKIVLELSEPYLDCGRTLYVDNWYISIELAESLNSRQTHLVRTLRANRKSNPKDVTQKKLKRGEVISMRSFSNILVLKLKNKRDLYILSTKHNSEMISIDHRGKYIEKPKVVIDYNLGKSPIDLSDQLSSYSNSLRRNIKWYKKVVLNSLLNIGVVNALVFFNKVTNSKMTITTFRTILVENLIKKNDIMLPEVTMNHDIVKAGSSRCLNAIKKWYLKRVGHMHKIIQQKCILNV